MKVASRNRFIIFSLLFLAASFLLVFVVKAAVGDPFLEWARIFDSGNSDEAYGIAIYDANNEVRQEWAKSIDFFGALIYDERGVAIDSVRNVLYSTGPECLGSASCSTNYRVVRRDLTTGNVLTNGNWGNAVFDSSKADHAQAVAVDLQGNVYVTGYTYNTPGVVTNNYDYRTVKFDPNGNLVHGPWDNAIFSGPVASEEDRAYDIAVDPTGTYVYVTGMSWNGSNFDFATIRYDTAGACITANNCIAVRYDSNKGRSAEEAPTKISIDASGNVYIAGTSYHPSTNSDYRVVKYTSALVQTWASAQFNGGSIDLVGDVVVDSSSGNIYVTGASWNTSQNTYDFATVKFNASGVLDSSWTKTFSSPGANHDWGRGIALDSRGDVYVVGYIEGGGIAGVDYRTIKYAASSVGNQEMWNKPYNGGNFDFAQAIAVDASFNVYVTGSPSIVKYAPDADIYVVGGSFNGTSNNNDFRVLRYGSNGTLLNAPPLVDYSGSDDGANDVAVDSLGNVYVTGYSWNGSNWDFRTEKFTRTLTRITSGWPQIWNSGGLDVSNGVAVDPANGDVYVTGGAYDNIDWDFITRKYSPSGALVWSKPYPPSSNTSDEYARDVAVDGSGNVYVVGYTRSNVLDDYDTLIVKYDASGTILPGWPKTYDNAGKQDFAFAVAIHSGNVYVTGGTGISVSSDNRLTVKYDSGGNLVTTGWPKIETLGWANGVAVDALGDVYVTGPQSGSALNFQTIKYASSSGSELWRRTFDFGEAEVSQAIAADNSNNIYITGRRISFPGSTGGDILTIKYGQFLGSGPACAGPLTIPIDWTDSGIITGVTKIRKPHVDELRAWINNQRQDVGLGIQTWLNEPIITANSTKIRAVHFTDMRTATEQIYGACGPTPSLWSESISPGNLIRKIHVDELRSAVQNAP